MFQGMDKFIEVITTQFNQRNIVVLYPGAHPKYTINPQRIRKWNVVESKPKS